MSDQFTHENFAAHVGEVYVLSGTGGEAHLTLAEIEVGEPYAEGLRDPFVLIFDGPKEPVLPEGPYRVARSDAEAFDLYVIPILSVGDRQSYQVVVN